MKHLAEDSFLFWYFVFVSFLFLFNSRTIDFTDCCFFVVFCFLFCFYLITAQTRSRTDNYFARCCPFGFIFLFMGMKKTMVYYNKIECNYWLEWRSAYGKKQRDNQDDYVKKATEENNM